MKVAGLLVLLSILGITGCGVGPNPACIPKPYLTASPTSATADHAAAAPGNQVQFVTAQGEMFSSSSGQICAVPTSLAIVHPVWTNPQPQQISISSANDSTNGTAVCTAATNGPVTLTGTVNGALGQGTGGDIPATPLTITVQLTCK